MSKPVGIISALPDEARSLKQAVNGQPHPIGGSVYHTGNWESVPVVLTTAGIGKVNTALGATMLFHHFDCAAVIFSGVAGGIDTGLGIGDVVIASEVMCYDYGAESADGFTVYTPGTAPMIEHPGDPVYRSKVAWVAKVVKAARGLALPCVRPEVTPQIVVGRILTADRFMNSEEGRDRLSREFGAHAVEMEGAALAQVAEHFGRDHLSIRAISDLAGSNSHEDFPNFLSKASEISAQVVRCAVQTWGD
ncbi:MAG: 5'-methylthioadenosine/adenosylhomocysteine nucleosidase [Pseudomonadota bacterium]